jgi:hypothetical protein
MDDDTVKSIRKVACDGVALAKAIVALESSPLQRDNVPPPIQALARALLKDNAQHLAKLC